MSYNTEAREKILDFLKETKGAEFSAEEILRGMGDTKTAKSTLFRQLSMLNGEGKIKRIASSTGRAVKYQYLSDDCCEHLHLKCSSCGKLIHLEKELSHTLEKELFSKMSFTLDKNALLSGLCLDCNAKKGVMRK